MGNKSQVKNRRMIIEIENKERFSRNIIISGELEGNVVYFNNKGINYMLIIGSEVSEEDLKDLVKIKLKDDCIIFKTIKKEIPVKIKKTDRIKKEATILT